MFLSGWSYRKSHVITGSVGASTNYVVGIKVYKTTGTDGTETVNGVSMGKVYVGTNCQDDFGDIRFTKSDGATLFHYWMETYSSGNYAIFWVEISDDLDTDATIYVYYGNASADNLSNGTDTFVLFDDFETNLSKWTVDQDQGTIALTSTAGAPEGNSCVMINDGVLAGIPKLVASLPVEQDYHISYRMKSSNVLESYMNYQMNVNNLRLWTRMLDGEYLYYDTSWHSIFGGTISANTWFRIDHMTDIANKQFDCYCNGTLKVTNGGLQQVATTETSWNFWGGNNRGPGYYYFDALFIRKFVQTEPAHSGWGDAEFGQFCTESLLAAAVPVLSGDNVNLQIGEGLSSTDRAWTVNPFLKEGWEHGGYTYNGWNLLGAPVPEIIRGSSRVRTGGYALRLCYDGAAPPANYIYKDITPGVNTFSIRAYVYFETLPSMADYTTCYFITPYLAGQVNHLNLAWTRIGGLPRWHIHYYNSTQGHVNSYSSSTFGPGQWYRIELSYKYTNDEKFLRLHVNGSQVTALNNTSSTGAVTRVLLGGATNCSTYYCRFDDLALDYYQVDQNFDPPEDSRSNCYETLPTSGTITNPKRGWFEETMSVRSGARDFDNFVVGKTDTSGSGNAVGTNYILVCQRFVFSERVRIKNIALYGYTSIGSTSNMLKIYRDTGSNSPEGLAQYWTTAYGLPFSPTPLWRYGATDWSGWSQAILPPGVYWFAHWIPHSQSFFDKHADSGGTCYVKTNVTSDPTTCPTGMTSSSQVSTIYVTYDVEPPYLLFGLSSTLLDLLGLGDEALKTPGNLLPEIASYTDEISNTPTKQADEGLGLVETEVSEVDKMEEETVALGEARAMNTGHSLPTETITLSSTGIKRTTKVRLETLTITDQVLKLLGKSLVFETIVSVGTILSKTFYKFFEERDTESTTRVVDKEG